MADLARAFEQALAPMPRTMQQTAERPSERSLPSRPEPRDEEDAPDGRGSATATRMFLVATPPAAKREPVRESQRDLVPAPPAVREPTAAILKPLVEAATTELGRAIPGGFTQAVVILTLDVVDKTKARFSCSSSARTRTAICGRRTPRSIS